MERWKNKVAVVTGASSGIGAAIVKSMALAGMMVVGLAPNVDPIEAIKKMLPDKVRENLHCRKCDVTNMKNVNETFDWVVKELCGVDVLVNNAGCLKPGRLCTMDLKPVQDVLQTNVMGVVACTKNAFQSMQERNVPGHIIVINSIAGHYTFNAFPHFKERANIYSPTKFAITCIADIYRKEFHELGTKVKITSISPGLVDTAIVPDEVKECVGEAILKPEDIAQAVMFTIATPPRMQVHEMIIRPAGEEL